MKKNTKKHHFMLGIFCFLACFILFPAPKAEAASAKTKAIQAYKKILSRKNINWGVSYRFPVSTKDCSFSLVYLNKDSIPELVVYNITNVPHAAGYGQLYTYYKGRVRLVTGLNVNDGTFRYYKKKSVFIDDYTGMGITSYTYNKFSKTKASPFLNYEKNFNPYAVKKLTYSKYSKNRWIPTSKTYFKKQLKRYVKSTKVSKTKFHKNTAGNRRKYLK